jgi:sugar fermentation stimulation protein A
MNFSSPLISGTILKRYKRFFVDVMLSDGSVVTAHCPNTGSMKTCLETSWPCLLSHHDNPKRKLKYGLEMISNGDTWIGVNTHLPNNLVRDSIKNGEIPELRGYPNIQSEFKLEKSRIDLYLSNNNEECFVEIKNVTLKGIKNEALFPDAVTERGKKHLEELISLKKAGKRACMFFLVQREDVVSFRPAHEIDTDYAEKLKEAYNLGVEVLVYQTSLSEKGIKISKALPFTFPF